MGQPHHPPANLIRPRQTNPFQRMVPVAPAVLVGQALPPALPPANLIQSLQTNPFLRYPFALIAPATEGPSRIPPANCRLPSRDRQGAVAVGHGQAPSRIPPAHPSANQSQIPSPQSVATNAMPAPTPMAALHRRCVPAPGRPPLPLQKRPAGARLAAAFRASAAPCPA